MSGGKPDDESDRPDLEYRYRPCTGIKSSATDWGGHWLSLSCWAGSSSGVWAFSPWARRENPARLGDRDFVVWAEQRCSRTQAVIDALPSPRQADSMQARAEQIDRGTAETADLVADLRNAATTDLSDEAKGEGPSDAKLVRAWLTDWDTYLDDRRAHAMKLRDTAEDAPDRSLRFLLSDAMSGGVYTERMDGFARLNNMDSCQIPGDL